MSDPTPRSRRGGELLPLEQMTVEEWNDDDDDEEVLAAYGRPTHRRPAPTTRIDRLIPLHSFPLNDRQRLLATILNLTFSPLVDALLVAALQCVIERVDIS